ncbi:hypothetical protein AQUCO_00700162v1 [Aquilegia coerulea]|uniref:Protein phosphatase n=1 Tax=Aquilegia coerulea TaxID=218851 RepID=A0A2G5EJ79_AQUCA|nr:hypothetical protein AQUCO_00700162v1 [Aquilegia coerulea]
MPFLHISRFNLYSISSKFASFSTTQNFFVKAISKRQTMAYSTVGNGVRGVFGVQNLSSLSLNNGNFSSSKTLKASVLYSDNKRVECCRKARMSLRDSEPSSNTNLVIGYFMFDAIRKAFNYNPLQGTVSKDFHTCSSSSSSGSYVTGAAPDAPSHGSTQEEVEQLETSSASEDKNSLSNRTLKLLSGSCYLPHPDKEETGGEDAHFICVDRHAIGVADGVGGWADVGINAGLFARELISHSVKAIQDEPKGSINPARVLEKAHSCTKAKGSSTACIIALTEQGLHAINLGDSGFVVVRDGHTVFQSPVQQHGFNFTYQLECGNTGDLPSSGQASCRYVMHSKMTKCSILPTAPSSWWHRGT